MIRQTIRGESPHESVIGYSRAVKVGPFVFVSGTAPGEPRGNPYGQAIVALKAIEVALNKAGGSLGDVVRTRMYVTHAEDFEAVGRAHAEVFRDIRPASTMVAVSRLIEPTMLVEIEADAVLREDSS